MSKYFSTEMSFNKIFEQYINLISFILDFIIKLITVTKIKHLVSKFRIKSNSSEIYQMK